MLNYSITTSTKHILPCAVYMCSEWAASHRYDVTQNTKKIRFIRSQFSYCFLILFQAYWLNIKIFYINTSTIFTTLSKTLLETSQTSLIQWCVNKQRVIVSLVHYRAHCMWLSVQCTNVDIVKQFGIPPKHLRDLTSAFSFTRCHAAGLTLQNCVLV